MICRQAIIYELWAVSEKEDSGPHFSSLTKSFPTFKVPGRHLTVLIYCLYFQLFFSSEGYCFSRANLIPTFSLQRFRVRFCLSCMHSEHASQSYWEYLAENYQHLWKPESLWTARYAKLTGCRSITTACFPLGCNTNVCKGCYVQPCLMKNVTFTVPLGFFFPSFWIILLKINGYSL